MRLEVGYRAALLLVLATCVTWALWRRLVRPFAFQLSDEELALAVERHDPESHESLISALNFERTLAAGALREGSDSPELMRHVVAAVRTRARAFAYGKALDRDRVLRCVGAVCACVCLGIGWLAIDRSGLSLWAKRNLLLRNVDWPRLTMLTFVDGTTELHVAEGDDLTVRVKANGVVPEQVFADCRFGNGERSVEPMTLTGEGTFTLTLQALLADVRVRCYGGYGETPQLVVKLVQRPRIQDLTLSLVYPEYMKLPPDAIANSEVDVRVPRGGRLEVQAKTDKPIRRAFLAWGVDKKSDLQPGADRRAFAGAFEPAETGIVTVDVLDEDTMSAAKPPRFFVRIVEDQAPRLDYKPLGVSAMITAHARIPGQLKARDDWGLVALEAGFRIGQPMAPSMSETGPTSRPESEPSFEHADILGLEGFQPAPREHSALVTLDLLPLSPDPDLGSPRNRLRPDMTLALRFVGRDNFGPGAPHQGESDIVTFRIVTPEKLYEDLQRRQEEQRKELLQIIKQQKNDHSELRTILSPTASDPRAAQAKTRLFAMTRTELALGNRTHQVAERYQGLLDEIFNNRLAKEDLINKKVAAIVEPLARVAKSDFPQAASLVKDFAEGGKEDVRNSAAAAYESILNTLERVLRHMEELETLALIVRDVREVIKLQSEIKNDADKHRTDLGNEIFGPGSRPSTGKQSTGKNR